MWEAKKLYQKWRKKIKSDNVTRSNREKVNIGIINIGK